MKSEKSIGWPHSCLLQDDRHILTRDSAAILQVTRQLQNHHVTAAAVESV